MAAWIHSVLAALLFAVCLGSDSGSAAVVVLGSGSAPVNAGNTALFVCVAHGNQSTRITWSSDSTALDNSTNSTVAVYEEEMWVGGYRFLRSVLEVCRVEPSMDGSNYTCVAEDEDGTDTAMFSITVSISEVLMVFDPEDIQEDSGNTVLIPCVAYSAVRPSITWVRDCDQTTLDNSTSSRVTVYEERVTVRGYTFTKSVLELCSIGSMDVSTYTCTADTGFARNNATFLLTLKGSGPGSGSSSVEFCSKEEESGSGSTSGMAVCPLKGYDYLSFVSREYLESLSYGYVYQVPRYLDGVSDEISIEAGLPFGDRVHYRAWVTTNGLISFDTPYYGWWATNFPSNYPWIRNTYLVAPFWNDYDIQLRGDIWYSIVNAADFPGEQYNSSSLNYWSQYVSYQNGMGPDSFRGTWALVASWEDVPHYPHYWARLYPQYYSAGYLEQLERETSYFQAVIITDTIQTYAIFTYLCGDDGTSSFLSPGIYQYAVVGYNAFGFKFDTSLLSARRSVDSIACANYDENFEQCGLTSNLLYKLNIGEDERQAAKQECRRLLNEDRKNIDYRYISTYGNTTGEPCPCSIWQAWREWGRFRTTHPDYWCFYQVQPQIFRGYSLTQQCCYTVYTSPGEPWGALVTNGPRASTLLYYHPISNPRGYSDEVALRETCCGLAGLCDAYLNPDYGVRPVDDCSNYVPPVWTWGWGDPHIRTLDGREYTFNGWGEYILSRTLEQPTPEFNLQGRTAQVPGTNATEFTAFCFGNTMSRVMVSNCTEDGSCIVLFDDVDISANLTEVNSTYEENSILLLHSSNNETIASVSGVALVFSLSSGGLLNFVATMPERLTGAVEGLMGNFDGNMTNEFLSRNVYNNASDRMIHRDFGVTWQVTAGESCFTYEGSETVETYARDGTFTPTFSDEIEVTPEIEEACQGNAQCIYDYTLTNDPEVGMGTLMTTMNNQENEAQSNNFPPRFYGDQVFRVTVGYANVYSFSVSDDQDEYINVSVVLSWRLDGITELEPVPGAPGNYTFTVNLRDVTPAEILAADISSLVFSALDSLDIYGELNPRVVVYACANNGTATFLGDLVTQGTTEFLNCECREGYDGQFCEGDRDDCVQQPCGEEAECVDHPAPMVGVTCVCPEGFNITEDGTRCLDLDECVDTEICEQICTNTEGSFQCSCWPGYRVVEGNPMMCEDINECELQLDGCQHMCTNSEGSYWCSCRTGFELQMDNQTCAVADGAACNSSNPCKDICVMVGGDQVCDCSAGYELDTDRVSCGDIDECSLNNGGCEQNCTNTMGSFSCSCYNGYILGADRKQCSDLDECELMGTCQLSVFQQEQIGVVEQCDTLTELHGMIPQCMTGRVCYNKLGEYQCICPAGTILVAAANGSSCQVPVVVEEGTAHSVTAAFPGLTVDQFVQGDGVSDFINVTNDAVGDHCRDEGTTCRFTEVGEEEEEEVSTAGRRKRQTPFVDLDTAVINTVVDLGSVMVDSGGNLVFNFYVEVTALDGTKYILDVNDLLAAVQSASAQQAYMDQLGVFGQFSALNEEEEVEDDDDDLELWAWVLIAIGCAVVGTVLSLLLIVCLYCISARCTGKEVHSDQKRILPADHDLKEWGPDQGEGGKEYGDPMVEETTVP